MMDEFFNILFCAHRKIDFLVGHQRSNMIRLAQVLWIINQNLHAF